MLSKNAWHERVRIHVEASDGDDNLHSSRQTGLPITKGKAGEEVGAAEAVREPPQEDEDLLPDEPRS